MEQKPYERLEGETKKAFEAFQIYRDMGYERSIRKVAQKLGKTQPLMSRWSAQYDWVNRAHSYDEEMDRLALLQEEKERKSMVKRHAKQAMLFQEKVIKRMAKLEVDELDPKDMIKWFTEAVKIERLSRGETTEKAEVKHNGEIKGSIEHDITSQIDQYEEVYKKLAEDSTSQGDHEGDHS